MDAEAESSDSKNVEIYLRIKPTPRASPHFAIDTVRLRVSAGPRRSARLGVGHPLSAFFSSSRFSSSRSRATDASPPPSPSSRPHRPSLILAPFALAERERVPLRPPPRRARRVRQQLARQVRVSLRRRHRPRRQAGRGVHAMRRASRPRRPRRFQRHGVRLRPDRQRQDVHHHRRRRAIRRPRHHPPRHLATLLRDLQARRRAILRPRLVRRGVQQPGVRSPRPRPRDQGAGGPSEGHSPGGRGGKCPHGQLQRAPFGDGGGRAQPPLPGGHQPRNHRDPNEPRVVAFALHLHHDGRTSPERQRSRASR